LDFYPQIEKTHNLRSRKGSIKSFWQTMFRRHKFDQADPLLEHQPKASSIFEGLQLDDSRVLVEESG
jgi:hypothetical protein